MSDNNSFNNMGDQIKDALTDALQNGNFQTLNDLVSQTVTATLDEVGIHIPPVGGSSGQSGNSTDIPLWQQALGPDLNGTTGSQNSEERQRQEQLKRQQQAAEQERLRQERMRQARQEQLRRQQEQQAAEQERMRQQERLRQEQLKRQQQAAAERQRQQQAMQQEAMQRRQEEQLKRQQQAMQQEQLRQERRQAAIQAEQERQSRRREELLDRQEQRRTRTQVRQMRQMQVGYTPDGRMNLAMVRMRQVGRVSGILYNVFGSIGFGFSTLLLIASIPIIFEGDFATTVVFLISWLLFGAMLLAGIFQRKRLTRAKRYVSLCDPRMFGQIEVFAKATGKSVKYVTKDLLNMLGAGMFPEGHLDEQRTCFMLNDTVFHQYLEAENNRRHREAEAQLNANATGAGQSVSTGHTEELDAIIAEGTACIRRLHSLNDQIPGEIISDKLYTLEKLLTDIFDNIREHPEQMHRIHKLMEYYLPTTLKLVETYADFDQISAAGEDIRKAKAEIENTLDTINQAFAELLNNLFQDAVFDATTDAQVLKTMLAKEGLTKDMQLS